MNVAALKQPLTISGCTKLAKFYHIPPWFFYTVVRIKLTLSSEQIFLEYSWHVKTIALSIYHENIKISLQENQESGHTFSKNKLPSTNSTHVWYHLWGTFNLAFLYGVTCDLSHCRGINCALKNMWGFIFLGLWFIGYVQFQNE